MRTAARATNAAYNEALGMTVNQLLFEHRMTRKELGTYFGVTSSVITRKLRGQVSWSAEELSLMASLFGLSLDSFAPVRSEDGTWAPAAYVPGASKAPTPGGAEAGGVPPVGLEPTTFGLKVRSIIVWLEYVDVLARRWMYRCDSIASNSAIAGYAGNSGGKGMLR